MKRIVLASLGVVAFLIGPALAQQVSVQITEYGIYTAEVKSAQRGANGLLNSTLGDIRNVSATTTVPARIGVKFGFRFHVNGAPQGQAVELRKVTLFPAPGLRKPNSPQPLTRDEYILRPKIGATPYTGYQFDDPWELVPGQWTIQIWQGSRLLVEQVFVVVR